MNLKIEKKYFIKIVVASLMLAVWPYIGLIVDPHPRYLLISKRNLSNRNVQDNFPFDSNQVKRFGKTSSLFEIESPRDICLQFICSFLFILLLFVITYYLVDPLEKAKKLTVARLTTAIVITLLTALCISKAFNIFLYRFTFDSPILIRYFINLVSSFTLALVILASNLYTKLMIQKQNVELENEKLIRQNLQSQYEALKNQISPHFLFNTLNGLQTLIRESPSIAQHYVNHLSSVLRYTLESSENELVYLEDELKFSQSYIFLLKMRYESNLFIVINIPEIFLTYKLAPLTIQILIENAVKHNEISKRNPLNIDIRVDDPHVLIVRNTIQEKLTEETGTGIGLANLSQRYLLFMNKDILIKKENMEFVVEVPLLNITL